MVYFITYTTWSLELGEVIYSDYRVDTDINGPKHVPSPLIFSQTINGCTRIFAG